MKINELFSVVKLLDIPCGSYDELDEGTLVFKDIAKKELVGYIFKWEHKDGVITYTLYGDVDGEFIKDIAIIPFEYNLTKR